MKDAERVRAELEAVKLMLAVLYESIPEPGKSQLRAAASTAAETYVNRLLYTPMTDDQLTVLKRTVLIATGAMPPDDPRLPKDPG